MNNEFFVNLSKKQVDGIQKIKNEFKIYEGDDEQSLFHYRNGVDELNILEPIRHILESYNLAGNANIYINKNKCPYIRVYWKFGGYTNLQISDRHTSLVYKIMIHYGGLLHKFPDAVGGEATNANA